MALKLWQYELKAIYVAMYNCAFTQKPLTNINGYRLSTPTMVELFPLNGTWIERLGKPWLYTRKIRLTLVLPFPLLSASSPHTSWIQFPFTFTVMRVCLHSPRNLLGNSQKLVKVAELAFIAPAIYYCCCAALAAVKFIVS